MLARASRRMTVDQFLRKCEGTEGKYELVNGEVYAMAGDSILHARIGLRIATALSSKLAASGCEPFNSDTGLRLTGEALRYPDVAIYCDPRDLERGDVKTQEFRFPKVIFELLSPSTEDDDRGIKVAHYKRLPSLTAIVLIDPIERKIEVYERQPSGDWLQRMLSPESALVLNDPAVTLGRSEIFGAI